MRTPSESSPYRLLQEELRHDPWRLLVACLMLNQTTAVQVRRVIGEFFDRWPTAEACAGADPDEVREVVRPLGLYNRRTKLLQSLSVTFSGHEWDSPLDLPGVGKYALDSYRMFVDGELVEDVEDKELRNYLEWARSHT